MAEGNPRLSVEFAVDTAQFDRGIAAAKQKTKEFADTATRTADGAVTKLGQRAEVAGAAFFSLRAQIAVAAGAAIAGAVSLNNNAVALERSARAANLSFEGFQRLSIGLQSQGVDATAAGKGLEEFSRKTSEARLKTGELYETLKFANPELATQLRNTKTTEQALQVYAEAIRRVNGDEQKALLARKAFGEAGIDLLPILSQGAAGVAEMSEKTGTFTTVNASAAKAAKDVKTETSLWATQLSNELANALEGANRGVADFFKGIREGQQAQGGFFATQAANWKDLQDRISGATSAANGYAKSRVSAIGPEGNTVTVPSTATSSDAFESKARPDFRGADAVRAAQAQLVAARGESARAIELEASAQIEAARRLLAEQVLGEKEFASIRIATNQAAEAKLVALRRDTQGQLRDLQIQTLSAEQDGFAVIGLEYDRDVEKYRSMVQQKLISEQEFQTARENLNRMANTKIGEENSKIGDKVREQTAGYAVAVESALGNALTGTFTSGKDAARAFTLELLQGLQRATVQALILKPLMEALTGKGPNSGAVGDSGGGILGGLAKSLGSIFTGTPSTVAAEGGGLRAGVPALINERAGRMGEVFIPQTAGKIVPGERMTGGGSSTYAPVYHIDARGAEIGVEQRIRDAMIEVERSRKPATAQLAGARRKFPLRAA